MPVLVIRDGVVKADSREVAKKFGKDHKNVLRDIRNLECSEDFRRLNFELFKIRDLSKPEGESTSHVEMTRDGLAFLVMGFTGAKAARWKELDIEAFNRMEAQLRRGGSDVLDKVATMLARGIVETEARMDRVARQVNERVDHLEEQVASLKGRLASARLVSAPKPRPKQVLAHRSASKREISGELVCSKFQNVDVRTIRCADDELWFVAKDACAGLELLNPRQAIASLDDDEVGVHTMDTNAGPRTFNIISESGFYKLVGKSRKPAAKAFVNWVTRDLLPTIRKTGSYGAVPKPLTREELLAQAVLEAKKAIEEKDAVITEKDNRLKIIEPRAAIADELMMLRARRLPWSPSSDRFPLTESIEGNFCTVLYQLLFCTDLCKCRSLKA
ncbi:MAG TPA: Rha family transcriptional regulator [Methylocella sp.]|nr:Rha family transcriptional regulator [Methylocella sp.]